MKRMEVLDYELCDDSFRVLVTDWGRKRARQFEARIPAERLATLVGEFGEPDEFTGKVYYSHPKEELKLPYSLLGLNVEAAMLSTKTSLWLMNMYLITGDKRYIFKMQDAGAHYPYADDAENREHQRSKWYLKNVKGKVGR
jgi:hypothetical protein